MQGRGDIKMSEYGALFLRRSIRKFRQEKVPEDTIQKILKAGMAAPSAHNNQPWEFIVMRDKKTLSELSRVCRYWTLLKDADTAIAVVANLNHYNCEPRGFYVEDCSACTQNMLIAAVGEGLGAVWLGCYPAEENVKGARPLLGVPDDILPFSIVALGFPAEEKPAHNEYYPNKVHWDKYSV